MSELKKFEEEITEIAEKSKTPLELEITITRESDKVEHIEVKMKDYEWSRTYRSGMLFVACLLFTVCKIKKINTNIKIR